MSMTRHLCCIDLSLASELSCRPSGNRYEPFAVAETNMQPSTSSNAESSTRSPAGEGGSAFNDLAGYLFGANKQQEKMQMTMPVFTDSTGNMQFVLSSKKVMQLERREIRDVEFFTSTPIILIHFHFFLLLNDNDNWLKKIYHLCRTAGL